MAPFVWLISITTVFGILVRPKFLGRQTTEAEIACGGAAVLLLGGAISIANAAAAIGKGTDVYLFLAGMMLLADLARREGVFDWLAGIAVQTARGSQGRLFVLIYLVGTVVTVFLSNDATAVVLTPAVYAAVKRAKVSPLPYLYICAFIANAASFVLPISNPANLVLYGHSLPPLLPWLQTFALPSLVSIAITFAVLRWRSKFTGPVAQAIETARLSRTGRRAVVGILVAAVVLIVTSALGRPLGPPTLFVAFASLLIVNRRKSLEIVKDVSWSVLALVAGLFIIVEALQSVGAVSDLAAAITAIAKLPLWAGTLAASFGIAAVSNLMNNLPSGLMTGAALQNGHVQHQIRDALLIGVDLGPNLSVTGSLATLLWLIAIRREGENVSAWQFIKIGALVMTPALLFSTLALLISN